MSEGEHLQKLIKFLTNEIKEQYESFDETIQDRDEDLYQLCRNLTFLRTLRDRYTEIM